MFLPHQNLSDEINRNIIRSEIEGGVYLRDLPEAAKVEVQTRNRYYTIVPRRDGSAWISGHPEFCPEPVLVQICGCNWGGSMPRSRISDAGCIWNSASAVWGPIITSAIVDIRVLSAAA
jgi:hypothetical protein